MKTFSTSKINLVILRNGFRALSPKDLTIADIDVIMDKVVPKLNEVLGEDVVGMYDKHVKDINDFRRENAGKELKREDVEAKMAEISVPIVQWEKEHGDDKSEVSFEDSDYSSFKTLLNSHAKDWFGSIDAFYSFNQDIKKV